MIEKLPAQWVESLQAEMQRVDEQERLWMKMEFHAGDSIRYDVASDGELLRLFDYIRAETKFQVPISEVRARSLRLGNRTINQEFLSRIESHGGHVE